MREADLADKRASHLVRSLRALARDPKASPKVRLRACELLVEIDPTIQRDSSAGLSKARAAASLKALLGSDIERH